MITNICLLLEELSVLLCIHYLYGEKFKFDIKTTSYLAIYMIIMTIINYYDLHSVLSLITYLVIAIFCGLKFGFKWWIIITNTVLDIVIIGVIQLFVVVCFGHMLKVQLLVDKELMIVNSTVFLIVLFILPKFKIQRLSQYLQDKERILIISLIVCILLTLFSVVNYKMIRFGDINQYIPLFVGVTFIFILAGQLAKYKISSKELEAELKMHQLYADSFCNLINEIRLRQHEFDNHVSTIYSLQYTCKTYEDLVNAQKNYGNEIMKENRHNKLLTVGNPLLIGFLYGKILEIEKVGLEVTYQVSIESLNVGIPIYRLVELLGNLIKNAIEALSNSIEHKVIYIEIIEICGKFEIEVRNRSEFIDYIEIEKFFKKGFSKKGNKRGLGLYNVKRICNEYSLTLCCNNRIVNNENWLSFTISNN